MHIDCILFLHWIWSFNSMIGFLKTEKRVGLGTNRVTKIRSPSWPSPLEWSESSKKKKGSPHDSAMLWQKPLPSLPLSFHFGGTLSFNPSLPTTTPPRERKVREREKKKKTMGGGREVPISLEGLRDKNLMQLKKLNTALFPVRYNDKYYADALASADFTKLGQFRLSFFSLPHIIIFYGFCFFLLYLWWVFVILVY